MERRDFIRLSAAGAAAGLIAPVAARAETGSAITPPGDIFYTRDAPGRWKGKEATHLPNIEVSQDNGGVNVKVVTAHEVKGYEHYIVKHVLLDKDFKFIAEHLFDPNKESVPLSTYTLKNYSGRLYALSVCNKHDLWLNSVEV